MDTLSTAGVDLKKRIREAFTALDPQYREKRATYEAQCKALQETLSERDRKGEPTACSQQTLSEAIWLNHYGCDWARIERQIARARASLTEEQEHAKRQDQEGSWGACTGEWYRKLEPTVDTLQLPGLDPKAIQPLGFLARLKNTPWVMGYLWRLQITDIGVTGVNCRDELGAVQTALAQLLFKDQLHDLLEKSELGFRFAPDFERAFCDYLEQTQNRQTGFWGPWYRFKEELVMANDLSFTFHIVNYRRGNIAHWPLVIDTTLAIKNVVYPYGWMPDDGTQYSLHNCYDVVLIFGHGWPHMDWDQKGKVGDEISAMLTWCLTKAVDNSGAFVLGKEDVPLETYYFGVRLLDAMGVWSAARRFWRVGTPAMPAGAPTPYDLRRSLSMAFSPFNDGSEEADTVLHILNTAMAETAQSHDPLSL